MRISLNVMEEHLDNQNTNANRTFAHQFFIPKGVPSKNVRFLIKDLSDVMAFRTHTVTRTSKKGKQYFQEVGCIGDGCPLCDYAFKTDGKGVASYARDKIVIPLVDFNYVDKDGNDAPVVSYWVRSSNFYRNVLAFYVSKFKGLLDGYVEVNKTGTGVNTTYSLFPSEGEGLPPIKSVDEYLKDFDVNMEEDLKSIILDYNAEQMNHLIPHTEENIEVPFEEAPKRRVSTHGF